MKDKRVVITGIGVICSNAIGKDEFGRSIFGSISGIKPITLFSTSGYKTKLAGEVSNFSPQDILGPKGLRVMDRSTKLVSCAAKLALDDAGLNITEENCTQVGVAIGSTLGSVKSMSDFDADAIRDGVQYVNPALFSNTVINSPASQVSIRFNIKGFNTTISTGFTSSLESFAYAYQFLKNNRVNAVLCGAVEELCEQAFLGFYRTKYLAGIKGQGEEISCPFDKRRNGVILGEASCVMVLEDLDSALERKAMILAEVSGIAASFTPFRINKFESSGSGIKKAMQCAISNAKVPVEKIDCILASANSVLDADKIETVAIKQVFGNHADTLPVSAVKSMLGECFSASGSLQAAAAVAALERQMIPATINYQEKDPDCRLDYVPNIARKAKLDNILINSFGPSGSNAAMVLSKFAA
ncbi:MAG: beta-ketoacyl-[acyl-carrier-protein] synthase family protein [Candidatus Omnitrophica bacterium]|nr:beta-ketoacyl-[acyl-carrier-protein] synthase family protein [Candidatus Omnitrophota bacterium]